MLLVIQPFTVIVPLLFTVPLLVLSVKTALVALAVLNELAEVPDMVKVLFELTVRLKELIVEFTGWVKFAATIKAAFVVIAAEAARFAFAFEIVRLLKVKVPVNV